MIGEYSHRLSSDRSTRVTGFSSFDRIHLVLHRPPDFFAQLFSLIHEPHVQKCFLATLKGVRELSILLAVLFHPGEIGWFGLKTLVESLQVFFVLKENLEIEQSLFSKSGDDVVDREILSLLRKDICRQSEKAGENE